MAKRVGLKALEMNPPAMLQTIDENVLPSTGTVPHDLGIPSQLVSLFASPIVCSSNALLSDPDSKENFVGSGVRTLSLNSPSKGDMTFKRPWQATQDTNTPKSKRIKSHNDAFLPMPKRAVLKPVNLNPYGCDKFGALASKGDFATLEEQPIPNKCQRSQSESATSIMQAVDQSADDPLLIGDCSKRFALPLENQEKITDLKHISGMTMSALLEGQYSEKVHRYEIIDCRYPYEYHGGHIKGAINLHTQKQVFEKYLEWRGPKYNKVGSTRRSILIFHCEFSSQRGPEMCRFMRCADRKVNAESFPSLHYPEMYILKGGYKDFYENHQEHCVPCLYTPMADPDHAEELRLYRNKSKTELLKSTSSSHLKSGPVKAPLRLKKFVL